MPELDTTEQTGAIPEVAKIPGTEECSVTLDGVRWRYLHAGSGPPLLLIHGFMAYSFSWRFNMEALSQHFSVYAIDLPGCGFSQRTDASAMLAGERCRRRSALHGTFRDGTGRRAGHLSRRWTGDCAGCSGRATVDVASHPAVAAGLSDQSLVELRTAVDSLAFHRAGRILCHSRSPQVALDDAPLPSQTVWRSEAHCAWHDRRLHRRIGCAWKLRAHAARCALVASRSGTHREVFAGDQRTAHAAAMGLSRHCGVSLISLCSAAAA